MVDKSIFQKFYLLFLMFIALYSNARIFGQGQDVHDAAEILNRYRNSLLWLKSVSMKVDIKTEGKQGDTSFPVCEDYFVFRRDDSRTEWIGHTITLDTQGNVDPQSPIITDIMTGTLYVSVTGLKNEPPIKASIRKNYEKYQKDLFESPGHGGALGGRVFGNSFKSVAELLDDSTNLHLRNEQETVNGVLCYVLDATTKYGEVTAWIAPDKGYNALKWTIHKAHDDLVEDEPISSSNHNTDSWNTVFDSVELQKVGDVFVTKGGRLTLAVKYNDGSELIACYKYKIDDIQLKPDFDALGAFKVDLPNGTPVIIEEFPGIKYIWQDGKPVANVDQSFLDVLDSEVKQIKSGQEPNLPSPTKTKKQPLTANECNVPKVNEVKQSNATPLVNEEKPNYATIAIIAISVILAAGTMIFYRLRRKQTNA